MTFFKKSFLVPSMAFLAIFAFAPAAFADIDEEEDVVIEETDGDADGLEDDSAATETVAVEVEEAESEDDAEPVMEEVIVAEEEAEPAKEADSAEEAEPAKEADSAEEAEPAKEADSAEEAEPAKEADSAEEAAEPAKEAVSAEEAEPAKEAVSAEEAEPAKEAESAEAAEPAKEADSAEEAAPVEEVVIIETETAVEPIAVDQANEACPAEEEQIELNPFEKRVYSSPGWRIGMAVLMWLPNRLLDLADCFSLGVGLGVDVGFNAQVTQLCRFGASTGGYSLIDWTYRRQVGFAVQSGWDISFLWFGVEDIVRDNVTGTMKPYWIDAVGIQMPFDSAYASGCRDYWAIGAEIGLFSNVRAYIHPIEIADFICGLFFIDVISNDDLTGPDVRKTEYSF